MQRRVATGADAEDEEESKSRARLASLHGGDGLEAVSMDLAGEAFRSTAPRVLPPSSAVEQGAAQRSKGLTMPGGMGGGFEAGTWALPEDRIALQDDDAAFTSPLPPPAPPAPSLARPFVVRNELPEVRRTGSPAAASCAFVCPRHGSPGAALAAAREAVGMEEAADILDEGDGATFAAVAYLSADRVRFSVKAAARDDGGVELRVARSSGCPLAFAAVYRRLRGAVLCEEDDAPPVAAAAAMARALPAGERTEEDPAVLSEGALACLDFAASPAADVAAEGLASLVRFQSMSAAHAAAPAAHPEFERAVSAGLRSGHDEAVRLAATCLALACEAGAGVAAPRSLQAACDALGSTTVAETRRQLARAMAEVSERHPGQRAHLLAGAAPVLRDVHGVSTDVSLVQTIERCLELLILK